MLRDWLSIVGFIWSVSKGFLVGMLEGLCVLIWWSLGWEFWSGSGLLFKFSPLVRLVEECTGKIV